MKSLETGRSRTEAAPEAKPNQEEKVLRNNSEQPLMQGFPPAQWLRKPRHETVRDQAGGGRHPQKVVLAMGLGTAGNLWMEVSGPFSNGWVLATLTIENRSFGLALREVLSEMEEKLDEARLLVGLRLKGTAAKGDDCDLYA